MNLKFSYQLEASNKLEFLDVSVTRNSNYKVEIYLKKNNNVINIYINWYSHAPLNLKMGLNKSHTYKQLNSELIFRNKTRYIRNIFTECNYYLFKVLNDIIDQEFSQLAQLVQQCKSKNHWHILQNTQLMVPYAGKQRHELLSKMKKQSKNIISLS